MRGKPADIRAAALEALVTARSENANVDRALDRLEDRLIAGGRVPTGELLRVADELRAARRRADAAWRDAQEAVDRAADVLDDGASRLVLAKS